MAKISVLTNSKNMVYSFVMSSVSFKVTETAFNLINKISAKACSMYRATESYLM